MGCKLIRGETIYFIRRRGWNLDDVEGDAVGEMADTLLMPRIYTRSDGRAPGVIFPSIVPIELQTFEPS